MPVWSLSEDEGASPRPARRGMNKWQSDSEDAFRSSVDYRLRLGEKKAAPAPLWAGSFSGQDSRSNQMNSKPATAPVWMPQGGSSSGPSWAPQRGPETTVPSWIPPRPAETSQPAPPPPSWIPPRPEQSSQPSTPQWTPKPNLSQPSWMPKEQSHSPQPWPTPTQPLQKPAWMPKSPEASSSTNIVSTKGSLDEPQVFDVPIIIQKDNVPIYIQKKKAAPAEIKPSATGRPCLARMISMKIPGWLWHGPRNSFVFILFFFSGMSHLKGMVFSCMGLVIRLKKSSMMICR